MSAPAPRGDGNWWEVLPSLTGVEGFVVIGARPRCGKGALSADLADRPPEPGKPASSAGSEVAS